MSEQPIVGYALTTDASTGEFVQEIVEETPEWLKEEWAKAEQRRLEEEAIRYQSERAVAYPPIGEQLDAIYAALAGDNTKLNNILDRIQEVKAKYPKPEEKAAVTKKSRKGK